MKPPLLPRPIIGLTFFFIKHYSGHYFRQFFKYSWWAIILLLLSLGLLTYVALDIVPMELIEKNDVKLIQEHLLSVSPESILMFLGSLGASFILSFYILIYTPNYYLLFTNYQTSFNNSDVIKTISSRFSRIIIYFFASILMTIVLILPLSVLTTLFAGTFLGGLLIPLLFGIVLVAYFLAFIEFMTVKCSIVQAFSFGFKTAISKLFRLTINFVFLMFTAILLTTFIQQLVLYVSVTLIKIEDVELMKNISIVSGAFANILLVIIISILQLYISIGYNEFEMENNYYNSDDSENPDNVS